MASTAPLASSNAGTLDVPSLVSQLMSVERKPIDKLNAKVSSYQAKISSFGTLKGLASGFQTAAQGLVSSLAAYSAASSDTAVLSASATTTAVAGSYVVDVTTLAKAQRLAAAGQGSDTVALTAADSTVRFTVGAASTDVAISAGASLQDIRSAINAADIGISVTIINDGSGTPYRLALSAESAGTANAISSITVLGGGDNTLNDLLAYNATENVPAPAIPMAQTVAAADADFEVNGVRIVGSSNTITDAIEGVTLTISKESASATLTVSRDTSAVSKAASGLVDAFNALANQLKSRSAYSKSSADVLSGDGTVRLMLDQLRSVLMTRASGGTLTALAEVGIAFQTGGTLKLDGSKLDAAMASDFGDVVNLFSSATGYATRMDAWATSVVEVGGLIDARTTSLNTYLTGFNDQISRLEVRMTSIQKQYTATYSNLNVLLSSMNKTGAYLARQFSSST